MRAVVQRVKSASVTVDGEVVSAIGPGLMVLVGVKEGDGEDELEWTCKKVVNLRLFHSDAEGKPWARSVASAADAGKAPREILFVSQFTLHASVTKGNKPDFHRAMRGEDAKVLYEKFLTRARRALVDATGERDAGNRVKDGVFGATMDVALVNDGPVTVVVDSDDRSK
tara:strand:- start:482 stop:988 length:507 start_codon:yes stop_codon:yes gene_type:complete